MREYIEIVRRVNIDAKWTHLIDCFSYKFNGKPAYEFPVEAIKSDSITVILEHPDFKSKPHNFKQQVTSAISRFEARLESINRFYNHYNQLMCESAALVDVISFGKEFADWKQQNVDIQRVDVQMIAEGLSEKAMELQSNYNEAKREWESLSQIMTKFISAHTMLIRCIEINDELPYKIFGLISGPQTVVFEFIRLSMNNCKQFKETRENFGKFLINKHKHEIKFHKSIPRRAYTVQFPISSTTTEESGTLERIVLADEPMQENDEICNNVRRTTYSESGAISHTAIVPKQRGTFKRLARNVSKIARRVFNIRNESGTPERPKTSYIAPKALRRTTMMTI